MSTTVTPAFEPATLSGLTLRNRIVMAPMTRTRAFGHVPNALMAEYYGQRASAGLIVTEGTAPSEAGLGYPNTPGLFTTEQVAGWLSVTDAVHAEGGVIFAQLMHVGRIGDPGLHAGGQPIEAPSAVTAAGELYTHDGPVPFFPPTALTEKRIAETIADFAQAARNAVEAGFDGVEVHGANGYLVHQFLSSNANLRTDGWGGSIAGRIRFAVEATRAVVDAIGADRVGIRISPANPLHDIVEEETPELYRALLTGLAPLGLAYVHLSESPGQRSLTEELRPLVTGALILNPATPGRVTGQDELALLEGDQPTADLLAYGVNFIANPDLVTRLRTGAAMNPPRPALFYGRDAEGYTDYPALG